MSPAGQQPRSPWSPYLPRALLCYLGALLLLHDDPGQEDHPDGHGGLDCKEKGHSGSSPRPGGYPGRLSQLHRGLGQLGSPSNLFSPSLSVGLPHNPTVVVRPVGLSISLDHCECLPTANTLAAPSPEFHVGHQPSAGRGTHRCARRTPAPSRC